MRSTAPYGSWSSPLRAARIAAGARRLPRLDSGAPLRAGSRAGRRKAGRMALLAWRDGAARELTPAGANVRTRVHEYGGGEVGSCRRRARLRRLREARHPVARRRARARDAAAAAGYADFAGSPDGRWLLAVRGGAHRREGARESPRRVRPRARAPRGRGRRPRLRLLAALLARRAARRLPRLGSPEPAVARHGAAASCPGARTGRAAARARWPAVRASRSTSPSSRPTGGSTWSRIARAGGTSSGSPTPGSPRSPRARGVRRRAVGVRHVELRVRVGGRGRLHVREARPPAPRAARASRGRSRGRSRCRATSSRACTRSARPGACSSPRAPASSRRCASSSSRADAARSCARAARRAARPRRDLRGRAVRFGSAGGREAHALVYRPQSPRFEGPAGERPPLVVMSHGGPTSAPRAPTLRPRAPVLDQRAASRVVDVNYGGSTGYGRAYRERLTSSWGVVDVEDCVARRALPRRAKASSIARGSSITRRQRGRLHDAVRCSRSATSFAAGASHYGIGDLEALARDTHKFESRYTDWLVGPWPDASAALSRALADPPRRAPLDAGDLLPGARGSRRAAGAGRGDGRGAREAAACRHATVFFPDEGHGFRRAENIQRALEAEL